MKPEDVGRKAMTNLDSVFKKNKDITLLTKVRIVKPMIFLVFTYSCESWTGCPKLLQGLSKHLRTGRARRSLAVYVTKSVVKATTPNKVPSCPCLPLSVYESSLLAVGNFSMLHR